MRSGHEDLVAADREGRADIMGNDLLHADDTPLRVLDRSIRDKGLGKGAKQGRIWAYVCDHRPWSGASPPGAVYRFAPDWKEAPVLSHMADVRGILQAPSRDIALRCPVGQWSGMIRVASGCP